jgi:hypothetical protein
LIPNGHAYLFDEKEQKKEDLAISYNNRCYAHMQLGRLQEAPADCQASLRYGNLPDAYQKYQELLKKVRPEPDKANGQNDPAIWPSHSRSSYSPLSVPAAAGPRGPPPASDRQ